ncbi:MAG: 50S ribosomal protein L4 [Candidatus Shikimatogenerans bostrichidophilus]|nr:MAG: 50S ribosomal protein L4 [Candidatus Shikimatogenerans bostrichidophilus]
MEKIFIKIIENLKLNKLKNIDTYNHLIYLYVKTYLNSQRKGNSKTKERGEIKGSTRKIIKQKGTGNSRKGSIKNPLFKGGGRIFGPRKRKYKIKLNKNIKNKVYKILIIDKILNKRVIYFKKININTYKTKDLILFFNNKKKFINFKKNKFLIITDKINNKLLFSSRNIKNINVYTYKNINYFNFFLSDYIIFVGKKFKKFIINKIKNKI